MERVSCMESGLGLLHDFVYRNSLMSDALDLKIAMVIHM